ncbi:MAG: hypothetical protein ACQERN_02080 [Thermodesulfobacteriota bacterium]
MFSTDTFLNWLDLYVPEWFAVVSGAALGIFGTMAIGFMVVVFSPVALAAWMPWISGFCGISGGYKFMEKRQSLHRGLLLLLSLCVGAIIALAAGTIQVAVNQHFFAADTPATVLAIVAGSALLGAVIGRWLRVRYEAALPKGV